MDDADINKRFGFSSFLTDVDRASGVEIAIMDGKLYHDITNKLNTLMADAESKYAYWNTGAIFIDYPTFYNLVRNKGPYDLKNQPDWQHDLFVYNNMIIRKDVPGNMLFGYLGKAMGIQEHVLLAGAGFAQIQAGTSEWWWTLVSYGDDPQDQYWIDYGFRTYRAKHGTTALDYIGDLFKVYR